MGGAGGGAPIAKEQPTESKVVDPRNNNPGCRSEPRRRITEDRVKGMRSTRPSSA